MVVTEFKKRFEKIEVEELYDNHIDKKVDVSICISTYNHEKFIGNCLDSILKQDTNFSYEILVGEDASSDNTREICKHYAQLFPDKIRLFLHHRENNIEINGSPTGRFNFLYNIYAARGKYIALCDGDDYWIDQEKLEKQVSFLENNPEYALVTSNARWVDEQGKDITKEKNTYTDHTFHSRDIVKNNFIPSASILFKKKELLIPDYLVMSPAADWVLTLLLTRTLKGFHSAEKQVAYRQHMGGIWSSNLETKDHKKLLQVTKNHLGNYNTYLAIGEDERLSIETRGFAFRKLQSYLYQYNRLLIKYPSLKEELHMIKPKGLMNRIKLLCVKWNLL